MTVTTSLKLPDDLKKTIAKVAAFEGKTSHALMVDTLRAAMEGALVRQRFYADGEAAYQDTLRSNAVYAGADVKAYVMARANGGTPVRPQPQPLNTTRAMKPPRDYADLHRAGATRPGAAERFLSGNRPASQH